MRRCRTIVGALAAWLVAASPAIAGGDLAEIEPKLVEKLAAIQSFRGDLTMTVEINEPFKMSEKMTGKVMGLYLDGKYYTRQEGKSERKIGEGEGAQKIDSRMLLVMDGELSWSEQEAQGQRQVMKTKPRNTPPIGKEYLTRLRDDYELSRAADGKVEGADCWVIDAKFKNPPQNPGPAPEKLVLYFRQNDGVMIRTVGALPDGKPLFTMDYTNIELNSKMDPSEFSYQPPEGVKVIDRTAPPPAPASASAPVGGKP